jgi:general secretion pathway protein E
MNVTFGPLLPVAFAQVLVERGLIGAPEARRALDASDSTGTSIERTLLEFGLIAEEPLFVALAEHLGLPFVTLAEIDPTLSASLGIAPDFLQRVEVVPVRHSPEGLVLATADPRGADALASLALHLRHPIVAAFTAPSVIRQAVRSEAVAEEGVATSDIERLKALANDGPVIKLVNDLIANAVARHASDVHIEAEEFGARVRFRVDGVLTAVQSIPDSARAAVVSRLKIMANLNISEKRRPQDGRADMAVRGQSIDIRLSTLPTQYGESVVLRLLDRNRLRLNWTELGFPPPRVAEISGILGAANGIFLIAGPTGSGKTTTLYTALDQLNTEDRKIVTVEDPIEYSLKGIAQVQVDTAIEMDFARALRSILRQDPDVIMVGEIRDQETAEIAVRAALVGRLVLSTIHTNDSISAVDRLRDLGVPHYLLSATLRGILSQRLVRRICTACAGQGCLACGQTGRSGRLVLSELFQITPAVADALGRHASLGDLRAIAGEQGFQPLSVAGAAAVEQGLITRMDMERALGVLD